MPKPRALRPPPVAFRLSRDLLDAIRNAQEQLALERPGQTIGRSDAVRALLGEALIARGIALRGQVRR